MNQPFNPLDMDNLGKSIATQLLVSDPTPLGAVPHFHGAGVYAIYYNGPIACYSALLTATAYDAQIPIYVGKAIPAGGRRGIAVEHGTRSRALSNRLREHARSVEAAENLDIADFTCRWLVVEPIWIPLGESVLISRFTPVWNGLLDGFGNHDPGGGRLAGVRSRWDTLHPGRSWAPKYPPRSETADNVAADVTEYLAQRYQV
ncbi:restriction endonuclease [Mycobacterium asiaticum]|uniref:Eco29kI family restriction endonuclease n=1 Tax=Mycobacterium asiaticum TaxID=1790 RepID=UPI0007EF3334|nr:Eco29kI family restriction endonuclease [Mycobacterium asiaticum]OBK97743.1 restriction endonuclease [Mycobacterium asiaticum]